MLTYREGIAMLRAAGVDIGDEDDLRYRFVVFHKDMI